MTTFALDSSINLTYKQFIPVSGDDNKLHFQLSSTSRNFNEPVICMSGDKTSPPLTIFTLYWLSDLLTSCHVSVSVPT